MSDDLCPGEAGTGTTGIGQILNIRLRDGEPRHNVPRAVRDHGHEILSLRPLEGDLFELVVRKRR